VVSWGGSCVTPVFRFLDIGFVYFRVQSFLNRPLCIGELDGVKEVDDSFPKPWKSGWVDIPKFRRLLTRADETVDMMKNLLRKSVSLCPCQCFFMA